MVFLPLRNEGALRVLIIGEVAVKIICFLMECVF
jgi:hypothetical protein